MSLLRVKALVSGLLTTLLVSSSAIADEFQPITVRISLTAEIAASHFVYTVETRIPNDARIQQRPSLVQPENCEKISSNLTRLGDNSYKNISALKCTSSLRGATLVMDYGASNPGLSSIISVDFGDGEQMSTVLASDQYQWLIPPALSNSEVAFQYVSLGFEHLLTGFDHLLFVICLLFICAGRFRVLVLTVTSFTIAHSLSLGLTAFGWIALHTKAVEAIIALSIAYLATDIVRTYLHPNKRPLPLSHRHPTLIAGLFGLLHGLGFANILNEFGLPHNSKLIALLSFNIGIEIGQLVFIGAVLAMIGLMRFSLSDSLQSKIKRPAILACCYFVGIIAMFWTIERFIGVF